MLLPVIYAIRDVAYVTDHDPIRLLLDRHVDHRAANLVLHVAHHPTVLGAHPESGKEIKVMEGRFGPYVSDGATHATLPKSADPKAVTLDEAVALIDAKAAKGTTKPKRKSPARKKTK